MIRLSRIAIVLLAVIAMAATLPDLYWKAFEKRVDRPFLLYSAPLGEFVWRLSDTFGTASYADESGREYDRIEYEKVLPFFYYRDLHKWGELPSEVCGTAIDADLIQSESQFLRITPEDLHTPQIDLYPLFESQSIFARLEYPKEMFRIARRMEFVDAASNATNEELSAAFTTALEDAGFAFPARLIAGNPTTRKPFDEGYFVVDAAGRLFHVKMIQGEPWCVDTGIAPPSGIRFIGVSENSRREFYGWLVTGDGRIHLLTYDRYRLVTLPVPGYDPDRMTLQMFADPLNRTLIYSDAGENVIHCAVTGREYQVVRTFDYALPPSGGGFAGTAAALLFPFRIETTSPNSDYVQLRVLPGEPLALAGIGAALLLLLAFRVRGRRPLRQWWVDLVVVGLTGVFGLLAVLAVGGEPSAR